MCQANQPAGQKRDVKLSTVTMMRADKRKSITHDILFAAVRDLHNVMLKSQGAGGIVYAFDDL